MAEPPLFAGMGGHQSAHNEKDEWLTPPHILKALGGADSFDLDPASPIVRPWPTAKAHYTVQDNGLRKPWAGRVFLNPPYGVAAVVGPWMRRMADHNEGVVLIFARTETDLFFEHVWGHALGVLFIRGRLHFHYPDGEEPERCASVGKHVFIAKGAKGAYGCKYCGMAKANGGAPSVLIAYGAEEAGRMRRLHHTLGHYVPLPGGAGG